jgi:hypothetical protein
MAIVVGAIAVAVSLTSCATLKVTTGWDKNVDFSKYDTWMWKADGSIRDPVWARRCQDVLTDELAKKKLAPIDTNPDLWGVVHARLSSETDVVPFSPVWGYGWGAWAAADYPVEYQVPVGTIIVDLVDARQKQLVWRGTASDVIQADRNNEQREERLIAVLAQMFAGYPPPTAAGK